jgi:hypothetical protein
MNNLLCNRVSSYLISDIVTGRQSLEIICMDHDDFGRDDPEGTVVIPLDKLLKN